MRPGGPGDWRDWSGKYWCGSDDWDRDVVMFLTDVLHYVLTRVLETYLRNNSGTKILRREHDDLLLGSYLKSG